MHYYYHRMNLSHYTPDYQKELTNIIKECLLSKMTAQSQGTMQVWYAAV